jgi:ribosome-associated protein
MGKKNDAEYIAGRCYELAEAKKAEDLIWLDVRDESSICDYFIICSGLSEPHLRALADYIESELAKENIHAKGVDGFPSSQWIILDYVHVLVHVFLKEKRQFYGLEQLWGKTRRVK